MYIYFKWEVQTGKKWELKWKDQKCAMAYRIGCNIFKQKKKGTTCETFLSTLAIWLCAGKGSPFGAFPNCKVPIPQYPIWVLPTCITNDVPNCIHMSHMSILYPYMYILYRYEVSLYLLEPNVDRTHPYTLCTFRNTSNTHYIHILYTLMSNWTLNIIFEHNISWMILISSI
jgi:hypothetical protein